MKVDEGRVEALHPETAPPAGAPGAKEGSPRRSGAASRSRRGRRLVRAPRPNTRGGRARASVGSDVGNPARRVAEEFGGRGSANVRRSAWMTRRLTGGARVASAEGVQVVVMTTMTTVRNELRTKTRG